MTTISTDLESLQREWQARWPEALERWSRFTRLTDPRWCFDPADEHREDLTGSFAMIRLTDQAVVVSLRQVREQHLERFAVEILAHEIGHHVYCPANLLDHGRMIARMRAALPTKGALAPMVANLYADLLINDRLQRIAGLDMAGVYRALGEKPEDRASVLDTARSRGKREPQAATTRTWTLYMRIYEILWSLRRGELASGTIDGRLEGDAQLGARLIRSYAKDWLDGAGRFAALFLPYVLEDEGVGVDQLLRGWADTRGAGAGAGELPPGLSEIDPEEEAGAIHPSLDPELSGLESPEPDEGTPPSDTTSPGGGHGQHREPFEYGEILRSLGMNLSDHEVAVRYYRERAIPYLIPFPVRTMPESIEPLAEGLERWDIGMPLEEVDWLETVLAGPQVVPGMTTVQRTWGVMSGGQPRTEPVDLDLYVDCSGSMPNPQVTISYLTLAGAIIALSAFRVGSRVQATLWSGARQFETTGGFISDPRRVLEILTGYLGGATAFPIHLLRDTYATRKPTDRAVHILVISDDGVDTMFHKDERHNSGWDIARTALERARGGGTLALNLYREWQDVPVLAWAAEEGWHIHRVQDWEGLIAFARAFSRANYGERKPERSHA